MTTLKQHAEKIKNMAINPHTPLDLYGINMFNTNFSSLEKVYDQDGFLAYFFKDQDMIFILEKASLDLVNRIYLSMPKVESKIEIEDVKTLCAFFMDEKNKDVLDYMLEKGLMNEKVHKKLSKLIKE